MTGPWDFIKFVSEYSIISQRQSHNLKWPIHTADSYKAFTGCDGFASLWRFFSHKSTKCQNSSEKSNQLVPNVSGIHHGVSVPPRGCVYWASHTVLCNLHPSSQILVLTGGGRACCTTSCFTQFLYNPFQVFSQRRSIKYKKLNACVFLKEKSTRHSWELLILWHRFETLFYDWHSSWKKMLKINFSLLSLFLNMQLNRNMKTKETENPLNETPGN